MALTHATASLMQCTCHSFSGLVHCPIHGVGSGVFGTLPSKGPVEVFRDDTSEYDRGYKDGVAAAMKLAGIK